MRDIYNMIIRRALSEVKKKIRPRPPGGSRFGFKPGPGSRAGGKGFVPVHERRTAGRCDLFGGQLMLTGLQADIGIQLCRDDVLRQTASSPMTYHTAIQMRQRMRVSSSFFERKKSGECSVHSQFSSDFRNCGASKQGRAPQLNCIKLSQEYSKKETAECVFLLTQDALCDSRGTHSAIFFLS